MRTKLRGLPASQAFKDVLGRSFAAAALGFLIAGSLHAAGAISDSVIIICSMEAAFFGAMTISLAYYHHRWKLGTLGTVFAFLLPYFVNLLWIKLCSYSLVYPTVALVLVGGVIAELVHRKISGPESDYAIEEEAIRSLIEKMDSNAGAMVCLNGKSRIAATTAMINGKREVLISATAYQCVRL